jgi:hypothetical protein
MRKIIATAFVSLDGSGCPVLRVLCEEPALSLRRVLLNRPCGQKLTAMFAADASITTSPARRGGRNWSYSPGREPWVRLGKNRSRGSGDTTGIAWLIEHRERP